MVILFFHKLSFTQNNNGKFVPKWRSGYEILYNCPLPISEITNISKNDLFQYRDMIKEIYLIDQKCRKKGQQYFQENVAYVDSLTFYTFQKFCLKYGYFSPRYDIVGKYVPPEDKFYLHMLTLLMHFSDMHALELVKLIEESIYKGTCNEVDLMEYVIRYIKRNHQYTLYNFHGGLGRSCGIPFHVIIFPSLTTNKYKSYYKFAISKYLEKCSEKNNSFGFVWLNNTYINNDRKVKSYQLKCFMSFLPKKYINEFLPYYINDIRGYILSMTPYFFNEGNYDILITTNPEVFPIIPSLI